MKDYNLNTSFNKVCLMDNDILNDLEKRCDVLKSKLIRRQLKCGNYSFTYCDKICQNILSEYIKSGSFFKVAEHLGINLNTIMGWYIQGQTGNPIFQSFYMEINRINRRIDIDVKPDISENKTEPVQQDIMQEDYIISEYGDGVSYKTFIDGEKIFIIANTLEELKKKVKNKRLPLDS